MNIYSPLDGEYAMQNLNFHCPKCSSTEYEIGQFRVKGGLLTNASDFQSQRFSTVTCAKCKYTEIYKADKNMLDHIYDMFKN